MDDSCKHQIFIRIINSVLVYHSDCAGAVKDVWALISWLNFGQMAYRINSFPPAIFGNIACPPH